MNTSGIHTCPASQFIADMEQATAERKAHFASMTPHEKAKQIFDLAENAAMKDDIRGAVSELAFHLMAELELAK